MTRGKAKRLRALIETMSAQMNDNLRGGTYEHTDRD